MNFAEYPIKRGDRRRINITIRKNGTPTDVTGFAVEFKVKGGPIDFTLGIGTGIEILDAANGVVQATILPEHTEPATKDVVCEVLVRLIPPSDGPFTPKPLGEKWLVKF